VLITRKDEDSIELTQTGLMDRTIMAMALDDTNIAQTPEEYGGPGKDLLVMDCQEKWSYRSVLGMMLCLCNTQQPSRYPICNQQVRSAYEYNPKHSHE
jgi:hypothetical protein